MPNDLSYAQVADVLAAQHEVADANRVAFRGRLQHFQRLGFPAGINTGRGRSAKYGFGQVLMLALGLELIQFGLSPEKAVSILRQHEPAIRRAIRDNMKEEKDWNDPTDFWLGFSPSVMTAAFRKDDDRTPSDEETSFFSGGTSELMHFVILMESTVKTRLAIIHLSGVLRSIGALWARVTDVDLPELQLIIRTWSDASDS